MSLETGQLVFVKDEIEGWLPATVGATNGQGDDMSLELVHDDGRSEMVAKVSEDWLQRGDPSCLKGVEDMVKMDILTVGSVLHNLRTRYANQDIYTSVGSILAAINPYVVIPSLYDENCMNLYSNMATDEGVPPHPYELMELAYRGLITDHRSQSVLISGESGAGKTETTKYLLSYLSYRSSTMEKERRETGPSGLTDHQRRNSIGGRFSVEDSVVMSNPVMEAFANAKTTRNHNSSRFGKYIQVNLHSSGVVTGGRVTTYLLEKTRVARQLPGERSYHVFYQLCKGANKDMRARLGLKHASEYRSLVGGDCVEIDTMDDAEGFAETTRCMESIGLGPEAQEGVFRVVASVLHLLNVEFDTVEIPGQDIGSEVSKRGDDSSLNWASKLLGVKPDQLEEALVARFINPGGFSSADFLVVPSSPMAAESARDAVAKALYSCLFDWLVEKINLTLTAAMNSKAASTTTNKFIGLLDIFGFEAFGTNSLEQLLINYANERLQQQFNAFVFKLEEEEFAKQGLSKVYVEHCRVEFADNDDVIRLLEGRPQGILSLLKEESTLKTGTGLNLGKRYRQAFKGNDRFAVPRARGGSRAGTEATFGVVHFAGEVIYDATEFVEKNKDEVPTALHDLVLSSNDRFVANLLEEYAGDTGGNGARGKRRGPPTGSSHRRGGVPPKGRAQKGSVLVTGKFMGSLASLMGAIAETEPHYIRCVKPNEDQLPLSFQGAYILEQLNWMGMVQIVEIRQRGFSVRYPHNEFVCKYGRIVGRGPGQPDFGGPVEGENQSAAAWRDEAERISAELVHQGHMEAGKFHLGTTKIFLRTATQRTLDAAREEYVRKEAQQKLTTAIENRNREDLSQAVALAAQLRLRSPQVDEAKLLIRELLREEALERVHVAMEEEDFDVLIKAIQAAAAIGVRDPQLEDARSLCRDITHRKDLVNELRKATVGAGTCLEEGGDPVPHLEALDPILAELSALEATVKKAPTEEVDDARAIRSELKHLQEAPVLQAMEKEMAKDRPDMGTLRSLIAMASDEVGVELGMDTVDRCKAVLQEAEELQAKEEAALSLSQAHVHEERSVEEQEQAARAAAEAAVEAEKTAAAAARAAVEKEEAVQLVAVQDGSFRQAPATMQALARFRPEPKPDPVDVARGMDILVPEPVADAIRKEDGKNRSGGSAVLQESLGRLLRDLQMNGVRQIPREPAEKPKANPLSSSPPKEEGKEDYPYRHIPLYTANVRSSHRTGLHMSNFELLEALKKGTNLLTIYKGTFGKRKTAVKWVSVSDDLTKLRWSDPKSSSGAKSMDLTATGTDAITGLTVGLETPMLLKEWESTPAKKRLPSEWCYFSLHTPARTYDFGSEDASVVLLWCIGLTAIIPEAGRKPPLCRTQKTFARKIDHRATDEEPVPLCPLLWPIARQVASTANDLGINDPCYRHQWWSAVELVESPLPNGFSRVVREDGTLAYRYPKSSDTPGKIGTHPLLQDYMNKIDYDSKLSTSHLRRSSRDRRRSGQALAGSHPILCFVSCFKGDLTAIRRFAMEGGDVDCRYEDAYERPWTVAMGGPDFSWAEPGLGTNPLNYTLAFCDIIGADTAARVVATLLELGADVNRDDGDPEVRYTPLHSAVANEAPDLVRTVLEHGARVNTPRGDRRIPLHTAMRLPAGHKKLSIVATLLVVGADIDRPEPFQGNTPLHMACKMGDLRTVELLLEAGADVTITNGGQRTASELVRVEISELNKYAEELMAEVDQEEGEGNGPNYKGAVDLKAELGRTQSKVEKIREIVVVLEEWMPPGEDDAEDVLDGMDQAMNTTTDSPTVQVEGDESESEEEEGVTGTGTLANGVSAETLAYQKEKEGGEEDEEGEPRLPAYDELLPPVPVKGEDIGVVVGGGEDVVGEAAVEVEVEMEVAPADGSKAIVEKTAADAPVPA